MICYLDMDGVLTDFVKGALRAHDRHIPDGEVCWDFHETLNIDPTDFWRPLGYEFWANLEWHAEGYRLLKGLEERFEHIAILTSPCDTPGCAQGKIDWIANEIPAYRRKFILGPAKYLCASPGHILIDDSDHNVERFEEHGGFAALVPRSWNKNKSKTTQNRFDVEEFLSDLDRKVIECTTD